jgi:hypothetical protein
MMPKQIYRQARIWRRDLEVNQHVLYLFGDNELRKGLGGQAKEMRGELNAIGIRTKRAPGMAYNDFWHDEQDDEFILQCKMVGEDFVPVVQHLQRGGLICIPADGLGAGLSKMSVHCPRTKAYLDAHIQDLENWYN